MTNLNATEVRRRVKESWSRFCGSSGLTANVANDNALMKNYNIVHTMKNSLNLSKIDILYHLKSFYHD